MNPGRALAVGAFLISLWVFLGGIDSDELTAVPAPISTPAITTVAPTEASTPVETPTPTPTPSRAADGMPLAIAIPAIKYSSSTPLLVIGDTNAIVPGDFEHTFWIVDRGDQPGAEANNTTYFACHTYSTRTVKEVPCNALPGAVHMGMQIVVETGRGQLTYTVTAEPRKVLRADFASDKEVWGVNPGRLVWVTCYITNSQRTSYNYVIIAELDK